MSMVNAFDPSSVSDLDDEERRLIERRARLLGPAYRLFYERPVHVVRGQGVWLYDKKGQPYLDVYNNVPSVGHSHPAVVEALARQASTLNTHTRYLGETVLDYAEALLATFPAELSNVMFTCTGSEANDLARRVAQAHTGGSGMVVTRLAYHGVTASIAELSPSLGAAVPLGRDVRTVAAPDAYRGEGGDLGERFARDVDAAFTDLQRHGIKPAGLLVDTIFASDGVFAEPAGFLRRAVDVARRHGALFIADEVQPGFGRTGTAMWGFQRHGLLPDIVTMGKPMGNGHPMAGMAVKPDVVEAFGRNARYFNTFGGNAVSCAVGLAVLGVIEKEALMANALRVGTYLMNGLRELAAHHDAIGDVRGAGLFIGVELVKGGGSRDAAPDAAFRIVNGLRDRRVLISASGPLANVLKIRPPLCFSMENADMFLGALKEVLQ